MKNEYTAVVKQDGDWWVGWIEEVPGVNCQERSKAELLESLREMLAEALEFNRHEARSARGRRLRGRTSRPMKRRQLLHHPRRCGCALLRTIPGGTIRLRIVDRRFLGIRKSRTFSPRIFAKTWVCRPSSSG